MKNQLGMLLIIDEVLAPESGGNGGGGGSGADTQTDPKPGGYPREGADAPTSDQ